MKIFMPELPLVDRLIALAVNCTERTDTYEKELTSKDTKLRREMIKDNLEMIEVAKREIQVLKSANKKLTAQLVSGINLIYGRIYDFRNHATGEMESYDKDAQLISSRPLTKEEMQTDLFRKQTHGNSLEQLPVTGSQRDAEHALDEEEKSEERFDLEAEGGSHNSFPKGSLPWDPC